MKYFVLFFLFCFTANASPPTQTDAFASWFGNLRNPENGFLCCSLADCRYVESKYNDKTNHFEIKIVKSVFADAIDRFDKTSTYMDAEGHQFLTNTKLENWLAQWKYNWGDVDEMWVVVPDNKVNNIIDNPTGHAVVCWKPDQIYKSTNGVICFVPFFGNFIISRRRRIVMFRFLRNLFYRFAVFSIIVLSIGGFIVLFLDATILSYKMLGY